MFEIGNSLREARLRQGLDLARAEDETKIRAKYLQALEDERFEVLPGETYVKGFLRTYADHLGLDGQLYVDEFNSRFASADEPLAASTPPRRDRPRPPESGFVLVALAGIVAVAVLFVVAFTLANDDSSEPPAPLGEPTGTQRSGVAGARSGSRSSRTSPRTVKLALTAARGDCWVSIRLGRVTGKLLFQGTLDQGETIRYVGRRFWLQFGNAPSENLDVRMNGRRVRDFPTGSSLVVVSPKGVRTRA
ncbi:MAG: helix-turn-helix domain-containing protein [Actinomycetota bacterium]|nr:helix-turn-helix domain-containing protein [Actinomycetota bacterium]